MTLPFTFGKVVYYLFGLLYVNEPALCTSLFFAFYSFSTFLFYSVALRFGFSVEPKDLSSLFFNSFDGER